MNYKTKPPKTEARKKMNQEISALYVNRVKMENGYEYRTRLKKPPIKGRIIVAFCRVPGKKNPNKKVRRQLRFRILSWEYDGNKYKTRLSLYNNRDKYWSDTVTEEN